MAKQTKIEFNLKGLEDLRAKIGDTYRARVGILGSNATRKQAGASIDNATLGLIQMFGSLTKNIPPRDFLLMPVEMHAREIVQAMNSTSVKKAIADGDIIGVYDKLGSVALDWVLQAFATRGFGQWPPNAPQTIKQKKSDQPLIDTGELRRIQVSDVVKKSDI